MHIICIPRPEDFCLFLSLLFAHTSSFSFFPLSLFFPLFSLCLSLSFIIASRARFPTNQQVDTTRHAPRQSIKRECCMGRCAERWHARAKQTSNVLFSTFGLQQEGCEVGQSKARQSQSKAFPRRRRLASPAATGVTSTKAARCSQTTPCTNPPDHILESNCDIHLLNRAYAHRIYPPLSPQAHAMTTAPKRVLVTGAAGACVNR